MSHVIFTVYASPQTHKKLVKKVEKMEYEYQGKFKGKTRPTISEVKMYDVRIKKELVPEFMRDMNMMFTETQIPKNQKEPPEFKDIIKKRDSNFNLIHKAFSWIRRLTPLKTFKKSSGEPDPKYPQEGWAYVMFVGGLDDPHSPDDEEIL